jgi:hypothetical protein
MPPLELRFVSGPDLVLEPRVHLAPPDGGARHFNVLHGRLGPRSTTGARRPPARSEPCAATSTAAGLWTLLRYR